MTKDTRKAFLRPIRVLKNLIYLSSDIKLRSTLKLYTLIDPKLGFPKV